MQKPTQKPHNPHFSSGPCAKRPGWSPEVLKDACIGRSHRSKEGKAKLWDVIERSRKLLNLPADYRLGIVPASDTGAIEMAMWSLLGARGVDVLGWETFGYDWIKDILTQLKIQDVRSFKADFGALPPLNEADSDRDIVFTWNGTTSGVVVPDMNWVKEDRQGLTLCDATSGVFAYDIPWEKIDVLTYSWQKVMGGEGQHGMLVLSPRAIERLTSYTPAWPLPKIFRMTAKGVFNEELFKGSTINTPSMLCVEDALDFLNWSESLGGMKALQKRIDQNFAVLSAWVSGQDWLEFFVSDVAIRSKTSVCLKITAPWFVALDEENQRKVLKQISDIIEKENAGYDFINHRDAPPSFRIWGGATVESSDIQALTQWINFAYNSVQKTQNSVAA